MSSYYKVEFQNDLRINQPAGHAISVMTDFAQYICGGNEKIFALKKKKTLDKMTKKRTKLNYQEFGTNKSKVL